MAFSSPPLASRIPACFFPCSDSKVAYDISHRQICHTSFPTCFPCGWVDPIACPTAKRLTGMQPSCFLIPRSSSISKNRPSYWTNRARSGMPCSFFLAPKPTIFSKYSRCIQFGATPPPFKTMGSNQMRRGTEFNQNSCYFTPPTNAG